MVKTLTKLKCLGVMLLLLALNVSLAAQSTEGTSCADPSVYDVDDPFPRSVNIPQFDDCPAGSGENCAPLQIIGEVTMGGNCFLDLGALAANGNTVVRDASGTEISGRNFEAVVAGQTYYLCKPGVGLKASAVADALICCDPTPVCDGNGNVTFEQFNETTGMCETVTMDRPTCNDAEVCDGAGNITKQEYDLANCECNTVTVDAPVCDPDCETFDDATCACIPKTVTCDGTPVCADGTTTIQVLDEATCTCVTQEVAAPVCDPNCETYDDATCACVPKTVTCDGTPVCADGKTTIQVLDEATCTCVTQEVAPPSCDTAPKCDGQGNITIEIYDDATCACITKSVAKPTCSYGEEYNDDMCMCVPVTCKKYCDPTPVCDGNGWIFTKVLNPQTCECETKEVTIPTCATGEVYDKANCKCVPKACTVTCNGVEWCENGRIWKKVLDADKCECVTKEVAKPTCAYGQVYDNNSCKCVTAPCTVTCNSVEWCENGRIWKKVLDADKCECVTKEVAKPVCKTGEKYDAASCTCKPVYTQPSCDLVTIAANKNTITVSNLTAPIEIVKVFNSSWQVVYSCVANCNETQSIPLKNGRYFVTVQFLTSSWKQLCSTKAHVTVDGTTTGGTTGGTTTGGTTGGTTTGGTTGGTTTGGTTGGTTTGSTTGGGNSQSYTCGDVTVTYGNGSIHLLGKPGKQYFFKVLKRFGNWQHALNCTSSCGHEARLQNLQGGKYDIQIFNSNWTKACASRTIDLKGSLLTNSSTSRTAQPSLQLENNSIKQHAIYPNPASQELFVDLAPYAGQKGMVRLVNQFGQVVQQLGFDAIPETTVRLDLQKAKTGLHFLSIALDTDRVITEKILINK